MTGDRPKVVEGTQYRLNCDRTISPTLILHAGAGFYRFLNPDSSPPGVLNYDAAGMLGLVGSAPKPAGFPNITNLGGHNHGGARHYGPNTPHHHFTRKPTGVRHLTGVRGRHPYNDL